MKIYLNYFFSGEEIPEDRIKIGLRDGIVNGELTPVIVGSATKTVGIRTMLNMLIDYLPAPNELLALEAKNTKTGDIVKLQTVSSENFSGYVFKTTVDPYLGVVNLVKNKFR